MAKAIKEVRKILRKEAISFDDDGVKFAAEFEDDGIAAAVAVRIERLTNEVSVQVDDNKVVVWLEE